MIDPSIPLQTTAVAQPVDPLMQVSQLARMRNTPMQMQSHQLQLPLRAALARAYQNTPIDPSTGLPDVRTLVSNLAADPAGAFVLPQVIQGAGAGQAGLRVERRGFRATEETEVLCQMRSICACVIIIGTCVTTIGAQEAGFSGSLPTR